MSLYKLNGSRLKITFNNEISISGLLSSFHWTWYTWTKREWVLAHYVLIYLLFDSRKDCWMKMWLSPTSFEGSPVCLSFASVSRNVLIEDISAASDKILWKFIRNDETKDSVFCVSDGPVDRQWSMAHKWTDDDSIQIKQSQFTRETMSTISCTSWQCWNRDETFFSLEKSKLFVALFHDQVALNIRVLGP